MKVVILAGGLGTRLSEETSLKPKPMVEIGGKPILWHIMKYYSSYGLNDFVICLGYKGYLIKEYFANYFLHMSDVTLSMKNNEMLVHHKRVEDWTVTMVDTGESTMTGGRVKRIASYVRNEEAFCMTYGDGLGNVDLKALLEFHKQHGKKSTVTAVYPPGRFGALCINNGKVTEFQEKPKGDSGRINGGFFVLSPDIIDFIEDDATIWEQEPMRQLVELNEMYAYEHDDFWQPMDTLRDKHLLEKLWESDKAPWKRW